MSDKKKHTANLDYTEKIMKLCLLDDDFMSVVFEKKELAEFLLRIIIEIPDLKVVYSKTQYNLKNLYGRSVRLDILAKDSEGKIYNIEVQRDDRFATPERARLNSSLIDASFSKRGKKVQTLPETYIIFITENDVLGDNQPIYRIDRRIEGSNRLFGDGAHIIYVNGENREDTALGHLMADFACKDPDKFYYKELADETRYYKHDEKGVRRMCKIMEELVIDERKRMAINMLADGKLSIKEIAKYSGLTVTEVKALAKKKSA
ncbi:MAG: PD-(D/E)XK nuclease family transposase [Ruminococcus sp.]|nr:PD-(D/E)XK nuclease family transposase [Ruminococcus sp.]MCM1382477.1 PD-(D/E)XK nuclease family transposase [Muribaculaceae bacterium]